MELKIIHVFEILIFMFGSLFKNNQQIQYSVKNRNY